MTPVIFFESISIPLPRKEIYRRLGFIKGVTEISSSQKEEIERFIQDALSLIHLKGAGLRMPVQEIKGARIILAEDVTFESNQLAALLRNCREIVLMGATAGNDIMKAIEEDAAGRNVTRGIVFDATASETVDASLDWIMGYFNRTLLRENRQLLKKRYSAGYGDLLLETQNTIYRLLQLDRIGIRITDSCMLIPEKSVTAITGIR
jgi:Vitamin B12 dependent methionine synthase, activation domain